ncbi:hypothetical protein GOV12_01730 [Candidatus Pacearchaeota archaeon]|nr:hypothetical protein [Candidatus Pacearchaeota archaeon]
MDYKKYFEGNGWNDASGIEFRLLDGENSKGFLETYMEYVSRDFNGNPFLKVLKLNGERVVGSNPFAVALVNDILKYQGIRTATQKELEKILDSGFDLKGRFEDTGLVLRSVNDSLNPKNNSIASYIAKLASLWGYEFDGDYPLVLELSGLNLKNLDNSYGLGFDLMNEVDMYNVSGYSYKNNRKMFSGLDERALPVDIRDISQDLLSKIKGPQNFLDKGIRVLFTRKDGLSRMILGDILDLSTDGDKLADSYPESQIVLVRDKT